MLIVKVYLPNGAFLVNLGPFLNRLDLSEPDKLEITSHRKWAFVHPVVLSMVASLGLTVRPENISINIEAKTRHYFERMGLFKTLRISSGIKMQEHEPAGRFVPISVVRVENELEEAVKNIVPMLHLSGDPEQAKTIMYIIYEIARNVIEHAESEYGGVICAQYYPDKNKIRVGISDYGLGIRTTIRRAHKAETHLEAIGLALRPGITGTTTRPTGTAQNAGAGLFFTKSIARVNEDYFWIYSGDSAYKLLPKQKDRMLIPANPFLDRHSTITNLPYWKGTAVGIDITLNQTLQFQTLLGFLKNILDEAVRERKQQRKLQFKQPRFV